MQSMSLSNNRSKKFSSVYNINIQTGTLYTILGIKRIFFVNIQKLTSKYYDPLLTNKRTRKENIPT